MEHDTEDYTKAKITIHNVLKLEMDLTGLEWTQQLYKVGLFCTINYNLHLRKVARLPVWMTRIGGRWIGHTKIELV